MYSLYHCQFIMFLHNRWDHHLYPRLPPTPAAAACSKQGEIINTGENQNYELKREYSPFLHLTIWHPVPSGLRPAGPAQLDPPWIVTPWLIQGWYNAPQVAISSDYFSHSRWLDHDTGCGWLNRRDLMKVVSFMLDVINNDARSAAS